MGIFKKIQIFKIIWSGFLVVVFSSKLLACAEHSKPRIEGAQLGSEVQKSERCAMGGCLEKKDGMGSSDNSSPRQPANNVGSDFSGSESPTNLEQPAVPQKEKSRVMESRGPI